MKNKVDTAQTSHSHILSERRGRKAYFKPGIRVAITTVSKPNKYKPIAVFVELQLSLSLLRSPFLTTTIYQQERPLRILTELADFNTPLVDVSCSMFSRAR